MQKIDSKEPLTQNDILVHGNAAVRDPETGRIYECGSGAHPIPVQAALFAKEAELGRPLAQAEAAGIIASMKAS